MNVLHRKGDVLQFICPACNRIHSAGIGSGGWTWNNDLEKPTLHPSLGVSGVEELTDEQYEQVRSGVPFEPLRFYCHSFIRDGRIEFLSDCTHSLRNTTIDLLPTTLVD